MCFLSVRPLLSSYSFGYQVCRLHYCLTVSEMDNRVVIKIIAGLSLSYLQHLDSARKPLTLLSPPIKYTKLLRTAIPWLDILGASAAVKCLHSPNKGFRYLAWSLRTMDGVECIPPNPTTHWNSDLSCVWELWSIGWRHSFLWYINASATVSFKGHELNLSWSLCRIWGSIRGKRTVSSSLRGSIRETWSVSSCSGE